MKSISIVVPVFNQVHLTRRCFSSILAGSTQPQEIVVIDNHSTDETPSYLEEFRTRALEKNWNVKIITNEENRGVSAAWNQGIKAAQGDFIAIVNNDTWLMPDWDEVLKRRCLELKASMVGPFYDETPFDEAFMEKKARRWVLRNRGKSSREWCSILMFFDKSTFEKVGLFDERFFVTYEDRDMRERMDRAGLTYYKIGDCYVWHHSKGTRAAVKIRPRYEEESLAKFIEKWGFDPRPLENTKRVRYQKKWTRLKNRFGFF